MTRQVGYTIKLPYEDKEQFTEIANSLGIPPATALRLFIRRFIEEKGFPFEVKMNLSLSEKENHNG